MHLQVHSAGFMCPCYVHTGSKHSISRPFEDQKTSRHSQYEGLLSRLGSPHHAGCLHACFAIIRFLDVNKFPFTWCIA